MLNDIRQQVPDLYLSLLLAPVSARPALQALFALEAELVQVPARVSQPTLGQIRITWWRDQLAARSMSTPLLKELTDNWPHHTALLADFADTFGATFDDLSPDAHRSVVNQRATLWAVLVADVLKAPQPEAFIAAQAHYGLVDGPQKTTARPLKVIAALAARRAANRNNWLGDVWATLRIALDL